MTALLEYLDLLCDTWEASCYIKKLLGNILKVSIVFKKMHLLEAGLQIFFITAGTNSTSISSWHVQIGFVHKCLWRN